MQELVSTVESLMNEHEAIRGHMRQVRESVKGLESLLNRADALHHRPEFLDSVNQKKNDLKQAMGYMEDGLKNHHLHEEAVMPQLVGELIMKAIRLEHTEQYKKFDRLNPLLMSSDLQQFLEKAAYIKEEVEDICQSASLHSIREDGILYFLREVPE